MHSATMAQKGHSKLCRWVCAQLQHQIQQVDCWFAACSILQLQQPNLALFQGLLHLQFLSDQNLRCRRPASDQKLEV